MVTDPGTPRSRTDAKAGARAGTDRSFRLRLSIAGGPERDLTFDKDVVTIGRDPASDLALEGDAVSRAHAEIRRNGDLYALIDLKSGNGCRVNDRLVTDMALLGNDDVIVIGDATMRFGADTISSFVVAATPPPSDTATSAPTTPSSGVKTIKVATRRLIREPGRARGYLAPATPGAHGDRKHFVAEGCLIGKGPDSDLRLAGVFDPWRAALVARGFKEYRVYNVASSQSAVLVNGVPCPTFFVLRDGDTIQVGSVTLRFTLAAVDDEDRQLPGAPPLPPATPRP